MLSQPLAPNAVDESAGKMPSPALAPGRFARSGTLWRQLSGACTLAIAVGLLTSFYMGLATLAFAMLAIGLVNRQQKIWHVTLMNLGIALDLAIVLALELQRDAIATAIGFSLSPLQQAHIGASSIATTLYFPVLILGWKRFRGGATVRIRSWHMRLGLTAFGFRALGFILMFALLGRPAAGG